MEGVDTMKRANIMKRANTIMLVLLAFCIIGMFFCLETRVVEAEIINTHMSQTKQTNDGTQEATNDDTQEATNDETNDEMIEVTTEEKSEETNDEDEEMTEKTSEEMTDEKKEETTDEMNNQTTEEKNVETNDETKDEVHNKTTVAKNNESNKETKETKEESEDYSKFEQYFRPSNLPVLNTRMVDTYVKANQKDTILNYYSVLREAAHSVENIRTGCGTIGMAMNPYPIAYQYLSSEYQRRLSYEEYLKWFENKLHLNLIKVSEVPSLSSDRYPEAEKYFVEFEVIEGTVEEKGVFAYYSGFLYLQEEEEGYKIIDMEFTPENYLCAPYHSWHYDGRAVVEIEYGDWCNMIAGEVRIEQNGYEKKVYFTDHENRDYYVLFYQLTNGTDLKIADFKKNQSGAWEQVEIHPEDCLKNKER